MNSIKKIITTLSLLLPAILFAQTKWYVSPKGNDANSGTQVKPFASIERAITQARKTPGQVTIYLLQDTYYLKQPIVFTSEDSRKENHCSSHNRHQSIHHRGAPINAQP